MRIKRLDLMAFGPFTNRSLTFNTDAGSPGLHIIYGPNEAGKSSSLRAIKALLYGFEERTTDNFLHARNQLIVAGSLENSQGHTITFQRRKKRKADILDEYGNPLADNVLEPFLHGLAPEIFNTLYGIDHKGLIQGGKELLEQKGEVGQALFAAGAGLSALTGVIETLEKEASELFKPAGKLPEINQALKRYKDLQKESREASLSSKKWNEHRMALKQAEYELATLETRRVEKSRELNRLERLKRAIPELGSLKNLQDQIDALGDVVVLPPDFSLRNEQVHQDIREAEYRLENDLNRLKLIEAKKDAISLNKALIDHAELIDAFHQRLGEYCKGQKEMPEHNGMCIMLRKESDTLLKQIRPDLALDQVETLRPLLAKKRVIQSLSSKYGSITQQRQQTARQSTAAAQVLKEAEKRLANTLEIFDSRGLLQALKPAQKAGSIDEQIELGIKAVAEGTKECTAQLKRIGFWTGGLNDLMTLTLPLPDMLKQFENEHDNIREEGKGLEKEKNEIVKNLESVGAEIKKLVYAGEVPSEQELIRIREKREQGWRLLRRQWLDQKDIKEKAIAYDPNQPLPEAYEGQVALADHVADRLRREAQRVTDEAALRAREETLEESMTQWERKKELSEMRDDSFKKKWDDLWKPLAITPLSPRIMSGWLTEMDKLRYKVGDTLKKEEDAGYLANRRKVLRDTLITALMALNEKEIPAGESLGPVLMLAEDALERIERQKKEVEKQEERREEAAKSLVRFEQEHKDAIKNMDEWQKQWQKALSGLGFTEEASPEEAFDKMELIKTCFERMKEADDLQKRIDNIDRDAKAFQKEVFHVTNNVAPELASLPVDHAILQLTKMLKQEQKHKTVADELTGEIDSLKTDVLQIKSSLQSLKDQQGGLVEIARVEKPDDLAGAIHRYAEYQRLKKQISETEANLGRIGEGISIGDLTNQAAEIDTDGLPGLIATLADDIDKRINPEIIRVSQMVGEETNKLAAMDGSSKAAETVEKMEHELSGIRRQAQRYVRVKLASSILQSEIERYREEHQEPVLKIATAYFNNLTQGSFTGLRTDVDDGSKPVLVGIRPDGARLSVNEMSDGTRDQLYLSLRLATLEWRLETSDPIPFIVDDILINFDDGRTRATLHALADLSDKNQVILFTHHSQVVKEAAKIKNRNVQIHHLETTSQELLMHS